MKINSVKLSDVTTYRFGGVCENFIILDSENDLPKLKNLLQNKTNFVIGKGSNIAFSDKGFNGNVILPQFDQIETKNESEIIVGSGVFLPKLSRFFKANMIANGEFLIGIPGTVGGAVKMNAGAYGWEFSDLVNFSLFIISCGWSVNLFFLTCMDTELVFFNWLIISLS